MTESGKCGSRIHVGEVLLQRRCGRRRSPAARSFGKGFPILLDIAPEVDPLG